MITRYTIYLHARLALGWVLLVIITCRSSRISFFSYFVYTLLGVWLPVVTNQCGPTFSPRAMLRNTDIIQSQSSRCSWREICKIAGTGSVSVIPLYQSWLL